MSPTPFACQRVQTEDLFLLAEAPLDLLEREDLVRVHLLPAAKALLELPALELVEPPQLLGPFLLRRRLACELLKWSLGLGFGSRATPPARLQAGRGEIAPDRPRGDLQHVGDRRDLEFQTVQLAYKASPLLRR